MHHRSQAGPAVVHEDDRRGHPSHSGEDVVSSAEQQGESTVRDSQPAVEAKIDDVFEAVPSPEDIEAEKTQKAEEVRDGVVCEKPRLWDWQGKEFVAENRESPVV